MAEAEPPEVSLEAAAGAALTAAAVVEQSQQVGAELTTGCESAAGASNLGSLVDFGGRSRATSRHSRGSVISDIVATISDAFRGEAIARTASRSSTVTNRKLLAQELLHQGSTSAGGSEGTQLSQHVFEESVVELLTFSGCEELLRGSDLADVLHGRASIFENNAGTAETFEMSRQVDHIDAFLSHNWKVPRWKKHLALCFHYNFEAAVAASLSVTVLAAVATRLGLLPVMRDTSLLGRQVGIFCRLLCVPAFLVAVFYWRELQRYLKKPGPSVFLDKTCIHQVDKQIQKRGIEKLGAFLCKSQQMLVLYTDDYLMKLWTVYEVASFLALHPLERMKVIRLEVPKLFFLGVISFYLSSLLGAAIYAPSGIDLTLFLFFISGYVWMVFSIRDAVRDKYRVKRRLNDFSVQNCTCFCEDDRPMVYRNIAALIRSSSQGLQGASDAEALATFDDIVRTELPPAMLRSMGRWALGYRHMFWVAASTRLPHFLDLICAPDGRDVFSWENLVLLCDYCTWLFGVYPIYFALQEAVVSCYVNWEETHADPLEAQGQRQQRPKRHRDDDMHPADVAWLLFAETMLVVPLGGCFISCMRLTQWARKSVVGFLFYVGFCLFLSSIAFFLYLPGRHRAALGFRRGEEADGPAKKTGISLRRVLAPVTSRLSTRRGSGPETLAGSRESVAVGRRASQRQLKFADIEDLELQIMNNLTAASDRQLYGVDSYEDALQSSLAEDEHEDASGSMPPDLAESTESLRR